MRFPEGVPELTDGVVTLRAVHPEDDPRIVEACNDPETAFWLGNLPAPYGEDDARWWREHQAEEAAGGARLPWVVADRATDELLGAVDLFAMREGWDAEIGYWTHPSARGRGLTTAACRLVLAHAFRPAEQGGVGLVRVQGVAAEGNRASSRVLEKVGMQRAGVYRAFVLTRAGRTDGILYDVLKD
jgi:RimJ/RimL family protein N-acetyltransferase